MEKNRHSAEFRRRLESCDINGVRELWKHVSPHLPQLESDDEVLVTIHLTRTQMNAIPFKLRAYSHRWLCDNGYPSAMPDHLRPRAERIYPRLVDAVGISCNGRTELGKAIAPHIQGAMEDSVMESYADKRTEPTFVKARMMEARSRVIKRLLGVLSFPAGVK